MARINRFTNVMGAVPVSAPSHRMPTAVQLAATGAALPKGAHHLTDAQQRAWFGSMLFVEPVSWDGKAFVSGEKRLTPAQIARGER